MTAEKECNAKIGSGIFLDRFDKDPSFFLENFNHLELQDFVIPGNVDENAVNVIKEYKKRLENFSGTLSLHAPFNELFPSSMDPEVQKLALKRFSQALFCGKELGCDYMVVHSCYNPLIDHPEYRKAWLENSFKFWDYFLSMHEEDIAIAVENVWDRTPSHIAELLQKFKGSNLKVCLDTGHANIFSSLDLEDWISSLEEHLACLHVHDNHGKGDDHLCPGKGNIDFSPLFSLMEEDELTLVSEVVGDAKDKKAFLEYFAPWQLEG